MILIFKNHVLFEFDASCLVIVVRQTIIYFRRRLKMIFEDSNEGHCEGYMKTV